jgi:hypothetical protein
MYTLSLPCPNDRSPETTVHQDRPDLSHRQIAHRQADWRLVAILRVAETGAPLPAGECVFTANESGLSLQNCF